MFKLIKKILVTIICKTISLPSDILADYIFIPLGKFLKEIKLLHISHYLKFEGQTYFIEHICYYLGLQKELDERVSEKMERIFGKENIS